MSEDIYHEWEKNHIREIDHFAQEWRKTSGSEHTYYIEHISRRLKPEDAFIRQYRLYVLKYTVRKTIDLVTVEHYIYPKL